MNNAVAKRDDRSQNQIADVRRFGQLLEHSKPQLAKAMPPGVDVDRFVRVTQTVLTQNPRLMECERDSLFLAIMDCAAFGLEPDPKVGHIDILPVWDPMRKCKVAQARPRYGGYIELARRSGEVASVTARVVYENDHFRHGIGADGYEFLEHERDYRKPRGAWFAVYAVCNLKEAGSRPIIEVMQREEVLEIRDKKSDGWKGYVDGKIKKTPWADDEEEMARKTVVRRGRKYWPMSMDDRRRVAALDALETARDRGKIAHVREDGEVIDTVTGEIIDPYAEDEVREATSEPEPDQAGAGGKPAEQRKPSSKGLDSLAGDQSAGAGAGDDDPPFDDARTDDGQDDPGGGEEQDDAPAEQSRAESPGPQPSGEVPFASDAAAKKWLDQQQKVVEAMENAQGIDDFLGMNTVAAKLVFIEGTYPDLHRSFLKVVSKHRKML